MITGGAGASAAGIGAGSASFGLGVDFREPHGVRDSTADDRYDFSCLLGAGSDEVISINGRSNRPGFPMPAQADLVSMRDAGR